MKRACVAAGTRTVIARDRRAVEAVAGATRTIQWTGLSDPIG